MKKKLWRVKPVHACAEEFSQEHGLSVPFAHVLLCRGIDARSFDSFFSPTLDYLSSPFDLPDMARAVERVHSAVARKEKILVAGDYDVDGVTSVAIFNEYIKQYPGLYEFHIPHRVTDGYGLSFDAVKKAHIFGAGLIVAFDCGTNSYEEVEAARRLGMDVVVIDHHHAKEGRNIPFAFVNPKRSDCQYPFKDFSGGALSFKFLQALTGQECADALDLVALSLVCDVVPLKGENRILLREGLRAIRKTTRPAISALCSVTGVKQHAIDVFHIGFVLGPRINAAGRVAHAQDALEMFIGRDIARVMELARSLDSYNKARRDIEAKILEEAERSLGSGDAREYAIVVSGQDWHPGVLGIVASRLTEKYYRPSFVFSHTQEGVARGSARSIHSVHLMDVLGACAAGYCSYGGHGKAAGLELSASCIPQLGEAVNEFLKNKLTEQDLIPVQDIDFVLEFSQITPELVDEIESLKPYGEENACPLFVSFNIQKKSQPKKNPAGYSLWMTSGAMTLEAVFYDRDMLALLNSANTFDIVYALERNNYHNTTRLALKALQLPVSGNQ